MKMLFSNNKLVDKLIRRFAIWLMEVAKDIQLVEAGEGYEEQVPNHQHHAVLTVEFPAVGMRRYHQEDHRREQRQRRVD